MHKLSLDAQAFLKKNSGKKMVFTNGCFDILHEGHVRYLNEAKKLGDILVVGLNSDASVKRLKGENRPINNESSRKYVLENLKSIDLVEIFENDDPLDLIKSVCPKVLVKGGDWEVEKIIGHEFVKSLGGQTISLTFVNGFSTTKIIEKSQGKA
jgi:rfaE bifunctional protein nucleotidyltransferase chain/domain